MKKLTVIVPIYNTNNEYLKECIESIINQTLKDIEIILVNDGSTEENLLLCKTYEEKDSRVKVIHKENGGVSSARNEGIKQATTDYIMFVDADDWIDEECCKKAYNYIMQNSKIELVCWSYYKKYKKNEEKINIFNNTGLINCKEKNVNYYDMKILGSTCMKLYSKKLFENQYFNTELTNGEDVEFNFRVFRNINYIFGTNEAFYYYRIHNDSSVRKYDKDVIKRYKKTLQCMKYNLQDSNELQVDAYYSFGAIAYLMICINTIFTKEYGKSYFGKVRDLKKLSEKEPYKEILKNSNKVKLPFTRKLPLLLAKYHMYVFLNIMIKVKEKLMSR